MDLSRCRAASWGWQLEHGVFVSHCFTDATGVALCHFIQWHIMVHRHMHRRYHQESSIHRTAPNLMLGGQCVLLYETGNNSTQWTVRSAVASSCSSTFTDG